MKLPNRIRAFLPPTPPAVHAGSPLPEKQAAIRLAAAKLSAAVATANERAAELTSSPDPTRAQAAAVMRAIDRAAGVVLEVERLWAAICPGQPLPVDLEPLRQEVRELLAILDSTMPPTAG